MNNQETIGLIDSGVGGSTVLREALKQLPNERLIYLRDTARCLYDPQPAEQAVQFTWEMTDFLLKKRIEVPVITCNAATTVVLEEIKAALPVPIVGVILPGARVAVRVTENNRIGVIGTLGTAKSVSYEIVIRSRVPTIKMASLDYPKFVPIVESNQYRPSVAKKVVAETLRVLQLRGSDTLISNCARYPLLRPVTQSAMGNYVTLIDSGAEIVGEVSMSLGYPDIAHAPEAPTQPHEFYTTGSAKMFEEIANSWLGIENLKVQQIHLKGNENG